jgi:hypothetical protein
MQFKSLGEQIEFYLNPNHIDLWVLQKSFKMMIDRYYRTKLTSRTLFQLQDQINEIERFCEIIKLISNKKATKQCKEGVEKLEAILETAGQNYPIIRAKEDEVSNLTDAMAGDSDWFWLAYYLQQIVSDEFKQCLPNYEFQKLLKLSNSGWSEAWNFLKDNLPVLTVIGGLAYAVAIVFMKFNFTHEIRNKNLVSVLNSTSLDYQIDILGVFFIPLTIFVVLYAVIAKFMLINTSTFIDKNDVNGVNSWQDSFKFIWMLFIKHVISFVIMCGLPFLVYYNITLFGASCLIYLIDFITIICLYLTLKLCFNGFRKFLIALYSILVIMVPMFIPLLLVVLLNRDNLQVDDYIKIIEVGLVPVILMLILEIKILNLIGKICLSVAGYLFASWLIVIPNLNLLEFLELRNNPNIISLLKVEMNKSDLAGQLRDMGFYQLNYIESQTSYRQLKNYVNESQASDLQLESYVFTKGIESHIYFAKNEVALAGLTQYVKDNKNTICNSKLNRAVLSELSLIHI